MPAHRTEIKSYSELVQLVKSSLTDYQGRTQEMRATLWNELLNSGYQWSHSVGLALATKPVDRGLATIGVLEQRLQHDDLSRNPMLYTVTYELGNGQLEAYATFNQGGLIGDHKLLKRDTESQDAPVTDILDFLRNIMESRGYSSEKESQQKSNKKLHLRPSGSHRKGGLKS